MIAILETLSVVLIAGAFYWRVWREWERYGLTYMGYVSLGVMAAGGMLGVVTAIASGVVWLAVMRTLVYGVSSVAALTFMARKIHAGKTARRYQPHGHGHGHGLS